MGFSVDILICHGQAELVGWPIPLQADDLVLQKIQGPQQDFPHERNPVQETADVLQVLPNEANGVLDVIPWVQ
ncbi:hypothetical protein GN956_G14123 [Arapaima gigas]